MLRFPILLLILLVVSGCSPATKKERGRGQMKLAEMKLMSVEIPKHPTFQKVDEYAGAQPDHSSMACYFRSTEEYEKVKSYYEEKLAALNWKFVSEEVKAIWFYDSGARTLTFQKQDIHLTIEFAGSHKYGWDYSIDLSYGLK